MAVSVQLVDGDWALAYAAPSGVDFEIVNGALSSSGPATRIADGSASWVGLAADADGGFTVGWINGGGLFTQAFTAAGVVEGPAQIATEWNQPPAPAGFTSRETSLTALLPGGATAVAVSDDQGFSIQLRDAQGVAVGPAFTQTAGPMSQPLLIGVAPLATGGYVVQYAVAGALMPGYVLFDAVFDSQGQPVAPPVQTDAPQGGEGNGLPDGVWSVAGLPDGGFVAAWEDSFSTLSPVGALYVREFTADGQPVGAPVPLGDATNTPPLIEALPDGRFMVSFASPTGAHHSVFTEHAPGPLDAGQSGWISMSLHLAGQPVALALAQSPTEAVVLTTGALAVVGEKDIGGGARTAGEQTFDTSGVQLPSASPAGFADASHSLGPMIDALPGGFYEVTYAASSDVEIYNANGQQVFVRNAFTSPTAAFTPLLDGGFVLTDSASNQFALVDSGNAVVGWFAVPDAALGTVTAHALQGGGFVFTHAGSTHFEMFDAVGHMLAAGDDAYASASSFATGMAALPDGGFVQTWLSVDGGSATLDLQAFDASGRSASGVIALSQDSDPWHTQFDLRTNADGSVAVLFSQGGSIWGAQFAGGGVGPAHSLGLAGALSDVDVITLPQNRVGLAFLQDGKAWAEIFDPSTGAVERANLGPASGELSTVHALALADGGMAVSWHAGALVQAALFSAAGQASSPTPLPADLLGVDINGEALVLAQNNGSAQLLHYQPEGGLFWT